MTAFDKLPLIPEILKALALAWYTAPTPIQEKSIPVILEGNDLFGCAQTWTGKTASFAIPTLQLLHQSKKASGDNGKIKALILTPTRELAIQIGENFATYGKYLNVTHTVIFGWVWQAPQVKAIRKWADVVIATPGRLLDLMNQKHISLAHIQMFILDEADRMLDMGFIRDIKKILGKLPNKRQSLFFSATMPAPILELAHTILKNPMNVAVTPVSSTVKLVEQSLYFVDKVDKRSLLVHLLKDTSIESALVFTRTKHGADKVTQILAKAWISSAAIHGNKSQGARQTALQDLKNKKIRVLVATDIAARGIDINELSHVFIYDIPTEPETYVHRIWRTGRAGASGVAIAFCDSDEKKYLKEIIKIIKQEIPVVTDHPYASKVTETTWKPVQKQRNRPSKNNKSRGDNSQDRGHTRDNRQDRSKENTRSSGRDARQDYRRGDNTRGNTRDNNQSRTRESSRDNRQEHGKDNVRTSSQSRDRGWYARSESRGKPRSYKTSSHAKYR